MKKFVSHLRKFIAGGILSLVPLFLVYLVVRFIYLSIDKTVLNLIDEYIGIRIPGLGIIFTLLFLYVIGIFTGNLFGKWLLNKLEKVTTRIPIIGTIYQVGKQISYTISLPEKQVFQKVVLVNYFKEDIYTIGFITGILIDRKTKEKLYKVFVPMPPIPTTGTMLILKESQIHDPGWTVDEGLRTVVSAGIIGPQEIQYIND
jgi:uncharacterized membrane protein